jgi:biotin-dependent carboxylase-like uncharacterized protein
MIEVIKAGLLTTVQDLGRTGYAHLGVGRSGGLDMPALIAANRAIGNADSAACLETTLNGVTLRCSAATVMAVTGAVAPITVDGARAPAGEGIPVGAGAVVEVGPAVTGVRSYLAFAGGIAVAPVLGSRSTDTLSGLGPPPLKAGGVLPLGPPVSVSPVSVSPVSVSPVSVSPVPPDPAPAGPVPGAANDIRVRITMGPRQDWFSVTARDALLATPYTLTVKSNRIAARLNGSILTRAIAGELASEGIVLGAVQVPTDGQPVVFLADHPTTGGYPVIAVVVAADLPLLAQARPGVQVHFALLQEPARPWT